MPKDLKCSHCEEYAGEEGGRVLLEVRDARGNLSQKQFSDYCPEHLKKFMKSVNQSQMPLGLTYIEAVEGDPNI